MTIDLEQSIIVVSDATQIPHTVVVAGVATGAKGDKGDAGPGVASGGTTGQILAKNSNTDYDTEWVDQPNAAVWGSITGTLSDQTDLKNALDGKQDDLTFGNLAGTTGRTEVTGGTGAVIGAGASVDVDTDLLPSPVLADAGKALVATGAGAAAWQTVSSEDKLVSVSTDDTTPGYLATKLDDGTGISLTASAPGNQTLTIANTDTGSAAVSSHTSAYDHTLLHDPVTIDTPANGLAIDGDQVLSLDWTDAANTAANQSYSNTTSGLTATTTQGAIDEVATEVKGYTAGAVLFAGSDGRISEDYPNLHWDAANNRLGVRTATPTAAFDTKGGIRAYGPQTSALTTSRTPIAGGALADATWWYSVVALDPMGLPTLWKGRAESAIAAAPNSSIRLVWPAFTNASAYRVYRGTTVNSTTGTWVYFNVGNVLTWDDVGAAGTAGAPPTTLATTTTEGRLISTGGIEVTDTSGRTLIKNGMITGSAYADASSLDLFGGYWSFSTTAYYGANGPLLVCYNSPVFTGTDANPAINYIFKEKLNGTAQFIIAPNPCRIYNINATSGVDYDMNSGVTPTGTSIGYSFQQLKRQDTTAGARLFDWSSWYLGSGFGHGFIDSLSRLGLNMGATIHATAQFEARCATATTLGAIIRGAAAQSANLTEWRNSSDAVQASVCPTGCAKFSGLKLGIRTVTASPVLTSADYTIKCDCTTGNQTVTLPSGATEVGRILVFKKIDATANTVTIGTVDGASLVISSQYSPSYMVQYDGTVWSVI